MAESKMLVTPPVNDVEINKPNHMIIWLDKHIGKPEECVFLKSSFFLGINPTTGLFERMLNPDDISSSIRLQIPLLVRLGDVEFMFQAFDDPSKCYETIGKNLDKRIFLITSGSKGKIIVPNLVSNFPETFKPNYWIYIFCAKMNMIATEAAGEPTNDWAFDYIDHVVMENFQDALLARLVLDIATYFFTEGDRFENSGQLNSALQYFKWSKLMWERYNKMEKTTLMIGKIIETAQRIATIEKRLEDERNAQSDYISRSAT